MKVIYHCFGGSHSSPVAAAIHVGLLPKDRVPEPDQLINAPFFDKVGPAERGKLFFAGRDALGNDVFFVGRGGEARGILNAVQSGAALAGLSASDFMIVDTLHTVNWWMRIGGFLSRVLRLISIGRPLVAYGACKAYPKLVETVVAVQRELMRGAAGRDGTAALDTHSPILATSGATGSGERRS